ncbi:MAG: hypothetical protein N3D82_01730 [Ignisphaera sp.]|nr:hypothetical protein [Ignisphaera sp.]MCX8167739.1 hypothetical protein [Ignisphaera sp.]MDW8085302.1 hypothetical protein [Ignisphaera sp.]
MEDPTSIVYPRRSILSKFNIIVRKMYRKGLRYYPFRLSTLVDPLPPHEELYRFSEKLLRIVSEYEYPLIINTKSTLTAREPWIKYIIKLAEKNSILIQVSISMLTDEADNRLEPSAPTTSQRLSLVKRLSDVGVPAALRISPFIPSNLPPVEEIEKTVSVIATHGVKHVIFEGLRIESKEFSQLMQLNSSSIDVESYGADSVGGVKRVVRVSRKSLEPIYRTYINFLSKYSISFSTCKEGLFNLHTAEDCCGFYTFKNYVRRPTLWDVYVYVVKHGAAEPQTIISHICRKNSIVCDSDLDDYPRELSKPLKQHERKLIKTVSDRNLIEYLVPVLTVSDGKICVKLK